MRLEDIGDDLFVADDVAEGADFSLVDGVEGIGDEAVFSGVDECGDFFPKAVECICFQVAFENAVLDADAVIFAAIGYFFEPLGVCDVVGDDEEHGFVSGGFAAAFGGRELVEEGLVPPVFGIRSLLVRVQSFGFRVVGGCGGLGCGVCVFVWVNS